jgi:2',3'-cyclic-nucleotide 2'-phosphodiesterase/3'-nucleotidase
MMRLARVVATVFMAAGVLLGTVQQAAQAQAPVRITIIHDTHFHGGFENADNISLAQFAGLVKRIKAEQPNALFVGNGDDIAPSLYSGIFKGEHMVAALNVAGLDVDTLGNHEFDYGPDNLRERVQQSRFPWVTANVRKRGTSAPFGEDLGVRAFWIKEVAGVKLGFTGFAPVQTPTASMPGPDVEFLDPVLAAEEVVPQMRAAGVELVIVLSHIAYQESERLAASVDGIDIIVGDHASTTLEQPKVINNTIVSRRGDELGLLGQLDLETIGGKITSWTYTQHKITPDLPADEAVASVIAQYKGGLDAALAEVVGQSSVPLNAEGDAVRSRETNVGNLVADALREWGQADNGVMNGGGIRSERTYQPGPLTRRDIAAILPFPNYAAKVQVNGEAVKAMLENAVSQVETRGGRFLQVSGVSFSWDPAAPAGSRVGDVLVGSLPLDLTRQYTVANTDFMQAGGDGYTMLRDGEVLVPGQAGPLLGNVFAEYIADRGSIAPIEEGRIREAPSSASLRL